MKKIITLLLCGIIIAVSLPPGGMKAVHAADEAMAADVMEDYIKPEMVAAADMAATPESPAKANDQSKALEAAILAVKSKVNIPAEYSDFDYYFSTSIPYENSYWSFTWRSPDGNSYIRVRCDINHHITYYDEYDYVTSKGSIPAYLKSELKDNALAFIKQIAPEVYTKLEFTDANYQGIYNGTYSYSFVRKEKGVQLPDNTVTVSVDAITGKVKRASINWLYDTKAPSADAQLSKEQATEILANNIKMNLKYRMNYFRIFNEKSGTYTYEKKAFLVYEPDPVYISVDAVTGEVYLTKSEWSVISDKNETDMDDKAKADEAGGGNGSARLTEEEIKKINELDKLITRERAIELVTKNDMLLIDENLLTVDASLSLYYNDYRNSDDAYYVWVINLSDPRPVNYEKDTDTYRPYANATVDARTGKILSFSASVRTYYNTKSDKWEEVTIKYSKEEAQTILEKFLKAQARDKFERSRLTSSWDGYVAYFKDDRIPVYGGYDFNYNRFNEGIEFTYNYLSGSVDGVTGKIYSFYTNWDDNIEFESPKDAMTPEDAFKAYISKDGFNLIYEINTVYIYDPNYKSDDKYYDYSEAYTVKNEIRLVYNPDINPYYISPFTGKQLNYDGTEYTVTKPYVYDDIPDTPEYREILLLADMNAGFEGGSFLPNKFITVDEYNELLGKMGLGYWSETEQTTASDKLLTREYMAYDFIQKLGLAKVAALKGIYYTGYADNFDINPDYLGAVALVKGFGLMSADENNLFNPKANITRKDAITLIMKYAQVQREGVY